ncbi:hypothetical protein FRC17_009071 [Serendipita sp. 399]|nr:hypothetical protein FRC17_009071 [Serendipita sp. 399]
MDAPTRNSVATTLELFKGLAIKEPTSDPGFQPGALLSLQNSGNAIADWYDAVGGSLRVMSEAYNFAISGADFASGFLKGEYEQSDVTSLVNQWSIVRKGIQDLRRKLYDDAASITKLKEGLTITTGQTDQHIKRITKELSDISLFQWLLSWVNPKSEDVIRKEECK